MEHNESSDLSALRAELLRLRKLYEEMILENKKFHSVKEVQIEIRLLEKVLQEKSTQQ